MNSIEIVIPTPFLRKKSPAEWLVFANGAIIPFNGVMALSRLLMALFLIFGIYRLVRDKSLNFNAWPIWLWFCLPVCSLLWSLSVDVTLDNLSHDVLYPFIFFSLGAYALTENERVGATEGFLCGMLVVSLISIYLVYSRYFTDLAGMQRFNHGIGEFSTLLVLAVSTLAFFHRKWNSLVLFCFAVAFFAALLATQNRMGWLSLLAVVFVLGIICWTKAPGGQRKQIMIAITILTVILCSAYYFVASGKGINSLSVDLRGDPAIMTLVHNERFDMWRFWLREGLKNPWLGFGFGYEMTQSVYAGVNHPILNIVNIHAHNVYIDYFLQLGLLGLGTFSFAMGWLFYRGMGLVREKKYLLNGVALVLLLTAMLSKSITDDFFTRTPLLAFWMMVGVLLGPSLWAAPSQKSIE
jgi:O-antigen ligase